MKKDIARGVERRLMLAASLVMVAGACGSPAPNDGHIDGAIDGGTDGAMDSGIDSAQVVLASEQDYPVSIAVGDDAVYWINAGSVPNEDAAIMKLATGTREPIALATTRLNPQSLIVHGENVFWTNVGLFLETLPPRRVDPPGPHDPSLMKVSVSGGTPARLGDDGGDLTSDGEHVYWCPGDAVMKVPVLGGEAMALTTLPADYGYGLLLQEDALFWVNRFYEAPNEEIHSLSKNGGAPALVAAAPRIGVMAVDTDSVYFSSCSEPGSDCSLMKVAASGGAPVPLVSDQPWVDALAVDASFVYWLTRRTDSEEALSKAPLGGGMPHVLATWPAGRAPRREPRIALDESHVYFTDPGSGTVSRVGKGR